MRLFHFSEEPDIGVFHPRSVRIPSPRPPGQDWLNGPLVWAIDAVHAPLYLFPRDCPRILVWPTAATTPEDHTLWWGDTAARMVAYIETDWIERVSTTRLWRYTFAADGFEDLADAGMWVARDAVRPLHAEPLDDLPAALRAENVELRVLSDLAPLRCIWNSTPHASGLRLRNAAGWSKPKLEPRIHTDEHEWDKPERRMGLGPIRVHRCEFVDRMELPRGRTAGLRAAPTSPPERRCS